jgi:hypothetical protein
MTAADTLVLLGAGASVEAGIPTSVDLTRAIHDEIAKDQERRLLEALRFVIAGLIFEKGVAASDPFQAPDIESVFSAVLLLQGRDALELAPFIGSWHPAIARLEVPTSHFNAEGRIARAVESIANEGRRAAFASRDLVDGIKAVAGSGERLDIFRYLAREMLIVLARRLWLTDNSAVAYLRPLVESERVAAIATLNYDNSIELAGKTTRRGVSTGIDSWIAHGSLEFSDAELPLLKIHGSIDWYFTSQRPRPSLDPVDVIAVSGGGLAPPNLEPAVVFGAGNKLRAEGPFLDYFQDLRRRLREVSRLVVIGYSLRDEHINHAFAQWLATASHAQMILVDPFLELHPHEQGLRGGLAQELAKADTRMVSLIRSAASTAIPQVV